MNKQRNFVHCSVNYQTTANKLGVANNANIVIKSTVDEQTKKLQAGVRSSVDFAAKSKLFQFQPNTGTCSIFFVFCLYQQNLQPSASSSQVHKLLTDGPSSAILYVLLSRTGWLDFLPALWV